MTVICPLDNQPCTDEGDREECRQKCASLSDRLDLADVRRPAELVLTPAEPAARHSDPPSSHAAVKSISRSSLKEHILIRLTNDPERWFNDDDLIDLHHRGQRNIVARARQILETSGYIERSPDRMLPGDRITYKASPLGVEWREARTLVKPG